MTETESERDQSRRNVYMTLALNNPAGLTKYQYTKNMAKRDALLFWVDAGVLGFVKLGANDRGTKLYGLRSEVVE